MGCASIKQYKRNNEAVSCRLDKLQCCILIFSHNTKTNPRTDQCFETGTKQAELYTDNYILW